MDINNHRFSEIQKEILLRLAHAFIRGSKQAKSTVLNAAVNKMLSKDVHPNNFRSSCQTLEDRGLIMRRKVDLDWYINISPQGFEKALEWIEDDKRKEDEK